jgi:hypothetical protein
MAEITKKVDMMFVSDLDAHLMGRRFKLALLLPHTDFKVQTSRYEFLMQNCKLERPMSATFLIGYCR